MNSMPALDRVVRPTLFALLAVSLVGSFAPVAIGAANAETWVGTAQIPPSGAAPFALQVEQTKPTVIGTLRVGPASFPLQNGRLQPDGLAFSTVHDVRIIDATHTAPLAAPTRFNYRMTIAGAKAHIVITHADGSGQPNELDVARTAAP